MKKLMSKIFNIRIRIRLLFGNKKLSNDRSIKELMVHFRSDDPGHKSNKKKSDLGYGWIHYGLIRHFKPNQVLCIGSRHGYIPAILAQACKDNEKGRVDFVDPGYGGADENDWTGEGYWKTKKGKECFNGFGLGDWIKLYLQTSQEFVDKYKGKYEYIYIDGDHSYKGVSLDYKLLWPRLKVNGLMIFHDVSVVGKKPEGEYGVWKLWNKIPSEYKLIWPDKESGLGIVQKIKDEKK